MQKVFFVIAICFILFSQAKRRSTEEATLARAYGYTEREIEKLSSGKVVPPPGCGDPGNKDFFSRFRQLDEIYDFMENRICSLRKEIGSSGDDCKIVTIGTSVQGRRILAIEIGNTPYIGLDEKRVMIVGTMHAREWTSTMAVLISALRVNIEDVGVTVIPVANPDGYVYTWEHKTQIKKKWVKDVLEEEQIAARYWRKNRANNSDGSTGVDLNRNFGSTRTIFGTDKKSKSIILTESDIYQGPDGFSEPETMAIKSYYESHRDIIKGFFDVHCCIGALLEPFSLRPVPSYVIKVGSAVLKAMNQKSPQDERYVWRERPVSSASGSGLSSSWAFQEASIPLTYVLELRGKFVEKCSEIKPLGTETWYGVEELLRQVSNLEQLTAAEFASNDDNNNLEEKDRRQVKVSIRTTENIRMYQNHQVISEYPNEFLLIIISMVIVVTGIGIYIRKEIYRRNAHGLKGL